MTRPRCRYKVGFCPKYKKFKPEGVSNCDLCFVAVTPEEAETLRLKHLKNLEQTAAAKAMRVSQSTFQRVLASAHRKVSEALIEGKAIILSEAGKSPRRKAPLVKRE